MPANSWLKPFASFSKARSSTCRFRSWVSADANESAATFLAASASTIASFSADFCAANWAGMAARRSAASFRACWRSTKERWKCWAFCCRPSQSCRSLKIWPNRASRVAASRRFCSNEPVAASSVWRAAVTDAFAWSMLSINAGRSVSLWSDVGRLANSPCACVSSAAASASRSVNVSSSTRTPEESFSAFKTAVSASRS